MAKAKKKKENGITDKPWIAATGPVPNRLMVVAEAPGVQECKQGKVLVGKTGQETNHLLRKYTHQYRDDVYCTNVFKWELNDRKDYTDVEYALMTGVLDEEIEKVNPDVILALGAISTHWLLGNDYDMETLNGMPHHWRDGRVVVPSFHPAYTFHKGLYLAWVIQAFENTRKVLSGELVVPDKYPDIMTEKISDMVLENVVAIDTETDQRVNPVMVSASCYTGKGAYAFVPEDDLTALREHVRRDDVLVLLHNALFDLPVLEKIDICPKHWLCTMQMAFLIQRLPIGLKNLAYRLLRKEMSDYGDLFSKGGTVLDIPREDAIVYSCDDAEATLACYNVMKEMAYDGMDEILRRDCDIMPMVVSMMRRGIGVDVPFLKKLETDALIETLELEEKIEEMTVPGFNPGSTQQRSLFLYDVLELGKGKKIKKTKDGGGSTDARHLKKLEKEHPVVPTIQKWIEVNTLRTRYLSKLPEMVKGDGRIHAQIMMVNIPHSGRFAAKKPNLLAQPVRTEAGRRVKEGFVADDGFVFVSSDFSQVEMRIAAHDSQDNAMLKTFREGGDIHTDTAMAMFGVARHVVDSDEMKYRYPAKRVGFGVLYGLTAMGLARELQAEAGPEWTESRCQDLIDTWFDVHDGIRRHMADLHAFARRYGYVKDMWGRVALVPEVFSCFTRTQEEGLRRAGNAPIQSGAQGVIKEAMRLLWNDPVLREYYGKGLLRYIVQIHDDILAEIHKDVVGLVVPIMQYIMEGAVPLTVSTPVDSKIGERWGKMEKLIL